MSDNFEQRRLRPPIIWLNVAVFSLTFLTAAIGVPVYLVYLPLDWPTAIACIIATGFCGMSITAGYHRLWSHKTYQTQSWIRFIYAIGGAFAIQNSALHWSSDHRIHHRFVDQNDKDPYSAKLGFWYSHIGWMLREYQSHRYDNYDNVKDLQKDPIVMWQHKHYLVLVLLTNFGIPLLFGWLNDNIIGSLLFVGFLRLVISHHVTFFINSLAHMWGAQPYSDENTAKDNPVVALLTYGEGYHNFHHAFQYDYRNGIRWWQFDPTKWLIRVLAFLGLAHNLKRIPEYKIARAIAAQQMKKVQSRLERLSLPIQQEWHEKLQKEYENLLQKLAEFEQISKVWLNVNKEKLNFSVESSQLYKQYQDLKNSFHLQQKHWQGFLAQVA